MNRKFIFSGLVVLTIILFAVSCAINPVTGKSQLMLMSEEQEIQLGASYDPQVVATFGIYENQSLLAIAKAQTEKMGKISHRPNLVYHIKLLDSPVINAFAVPGGYIYLTRGILSQLNSEAELAGVIGHEMGHITARHTASQQTKQTLGQLVVMGGMMASEKLAQYAGYAMKGMELLYLRFSRDDERQADRLGVNYSSRTGYDARQMAEFFKVLYKMSISETHAGVPTFLSTHPDPGDRYNSVNTNAKRWQDSLKLPEYRIGRDSYLKLVDGIIYGDDPRQGYTEGNKFYHPEMKFQFSFPSGWQLQNSPMQITIAPADGSALILFTVSEEKTLKAAADSANRGMKLLPLESKNITVNGMPSLWSSTKQISTDQSTGAQTVNRILSYYINYGNVIYAFHGVSAEANYSSYSGAFESAMGSFAKLTDQSKINVIPNRIRVKQVAKAGTLNEAFTALGVKQPQMAELALLNNMELTDKVEAGKLLKVVGK